MSREQRTAGSLQSTVCALHPKFAGDHQRFLWPIGLNLTCPEIWISLGAIAGNSVPID